MTVQELINRLLEIPEQNRNCEIYHENDGAPYITPVTYMYQQGENNKSVYVLGAY